MNALPGREGRSLDAHKWIRSVILFPVYGQCIPFFERKVLLHLIIILSSYFKCFGLEVCGWQWLLAVLAGTHLKEQSGNVHVQLLCVPLFTRTIQSTIHPFLCHYPIFNFYAPAVYR